MERIVLENAFTAVFFRRYIDRQEAPGVVARKPQCHLGQVIGTEAKKVGHFRQLIRQKSGTRNFDHRTDQIRQRHPGLLDQPVSDGASLLLEDSKFFPVDGQRMHDLGQDLDPFFPAFDRGLDDRGHLHVEDLRVGDAQPASAMAQHGVGLVQLFAAVFDLLWIKARDLAQFFNAGIVFRRKLMQRRIDQTDRNGITVHSLKDAVEVICLERQKFRERHFTGIQRFSHDHFLDRQTAFLGIEKHMFRAAQPNAFGAHLDRVDGIIGCIRVGADVDLAKFIRPFEDRVVRVGKFRFSQRHITDVDFAGRTVEGNVFTLLDRLAVDRHLLGGVIDA